MSQVDITEFFDDRPEEERVVTERTHILMLLDTSGSMAGRWSATLEAVDGFFAEQAALPGECDITLAAFDVPAPLRILYTGSASGFVRPDVRATGGSTALYDSTFLGLEAIQNRASNYDKSLFVVVTDGGENGSRNHTRREEVQAQIESAREDGIEVLYLAIGAEAWDERAAYGPNAINIGTDVVSARSAVSYLSNTVAAYRSSADVTTNNFFHGVTAVNGETLTVEDDDE